MQRHPQQSPLFLPYPSSMISPRRPTLRDLHIVASVERLSCVESYIHVSIVTELQQAGADAGLNHVAVNQRGHAFQDLGNIELDVGHLQANPGVGAI